MLKREFGGRIKSIWADLVNCSTNFWMNPISIGFFFVLVLVLPNIHSCNNIYLSETANILWSFGASRRNEKTLGVVDIKVKTSNLPVSVAYSRICWFHNWGRNLRNFKGIFFYRVLGHCVEEPGGECGDVGEDAWP